jgi:membrane protein DedA with SNARE-associated domain
VTDTSPSDILNLVVPNLADLITTLAPHAILLALALPPVIRIVGHWIPEELFMVAIGVLAASSPSAGTSAMILGAVLLSHFVTDQAVYLGGRWLRPRLGRFPRIERSLAAVTDRLSSNPTALLGLVPARVLPLGRGAWLAGCGVVRIPWPRFAVIDAAALVIHLSVWSGLGWFFAGDVGRLAATTDAGHFFGLWAAVAILAVVTTLILWNSRQVWQPRTARVMRRAGSSLTRMGRNSRTS